MFEEGSLLFFRPFLFKNGANLDTYPTARFDLQERMAQTSIEKIGILNESLFKELIACLSKSKMVKNKFRRMLQE